MKSATSIQHITRKKPFRGGRSVKPLSVPAPKPAFSVPSKFDLMNVEKALKGHQDMATHHAGSASALRAAGTALMQDEAGREFDAAAEHEAMVETHVSTAAKLAVQAIALNEAFIAYHQKLHQNAAQQGNLRSVAQQARVIAGHQASILKLKAAAVGVPKASQTKQDAS